MTGRKHILNYDQSRLLGKSLLSLTSRKREVVALHFATAGAVTEQEDIYEAMGLASAGNALGRLHSSLVSKNTIDEL